MTFSRSDGLHAEQVAEARRHRLEEPDVDDRRGQVDVAHALAAHAEWVTLTPQRSQMMPLYFVPLYLPQKHSQSFSGTEDALAEQAVLLGTVRAVVDGLGLLDLAEDQLNGCRWGWRGIDTAVVVDAIVDVVSAMVREAIGSPWPAVPGFGIAFVGPWFRSVSVNSTRPPASDVGQNLRSHA